MAVSNCENCTFRAKYDNNPKSFLGRLWRWHANWCPGWKEHMKTIPIEERQKLATQYAMKKYITPLSKGNLLNGLFRRPKKYT